MPPVRQRRNRRSTVAETLNPMRARETLPVPVPAQLPVPAQVPIATEQELLESREFFQRLNEIIDNARPPGARQMDALVGTAALATCCAIQ
jgi:hypothetical protein